MKVLRGIGIEERLRETSFAPYSHLNRIGDTGEITRELPMPESLHGAPYLCMHRGDLHDALPRLLPAEIIHLGKKLTGLDQAAGRVTLSFADGTRAEADAVIGADGVHSIVRDIIVGPDEPIHKGRIAYRAVFPAALMDRDIGRSRTKWWGTDRHIVIYYTTKARSRSLLRHQRAGAGRMDHARVMVRERRRERTARRLRGFHEDVRAVLGACPDCHKWAILEREPLPRWSDGRVALLGDACHPMTPYMAQGAATSIEDAAVLARCLDGGRRRRHRRRVRPLRGAPQAAHVCRAGDFQRQYVDARRLRRYELALWLRRLECAAR